MKYGRLLGGLALAAGIVAGAQLLGRGESDLTSSVGYKKNDPVPVQLPQRDLTTDEIPMARRVVSAPTLEERITPSDDLNTIAYLEVNGIVVQQGTSSRISDVTVHISSAVDGVYPGQERIKRTTCTNDHGEWEAKIPPGTYGFLLSKKGLTAVYEEITPQQDTTLSHELGQAALVTGVVIDADNASLLEGMLVHALNKHHERYAGMPPSITDNQGRFELFAPAIYVDPKPTFSSIEEAMAYESPKDQVFLGAEDPQGNHYALEAMLVNLEQGEKQQGFELLMSQQRTPFSGRMINLSPGQQAQLELTSHILSHSPLHRGPETSSLIVEGDGKDVIFDFGLVPVGEYSISWELGNVAGNIRGGMTFYRDSYDTQNVTVPQGGMNDYQLVLPLVSHEVAGTLFDANGSPLSRVMVMINEHDGPSSGESTNKKGEFNFSGLQEGKYTLVVFADGGMIEREFTIEENGTFTFKGEHNSFDFIMDN